MSSARPKKKKPAQSTLAKAYRRLEHLHAIGTLFASFEDIDQTLDPALAIVAKTLPLRSAVLLETDDGDSKMIVWSSPGRSSAEMRTVKENAKATYAYLVGAASVEALALREQAGMTELPRPAASRELAHKLIVLPLVVANRPPFGALQLEAAQPLDKTDLMFVNALTNQLAIALDRDRLWRRDIERREHAEDERTHAEARGAAAQRSKEKYQALAAENARLYEQAQQAVRAREQILAIVSHDLKSPVATILLTAVALAKNGPPAEKDGGLGQAAGRIQRAAERMQRLIEDLLDFASIEAGRLAIERKALDAGPLLHEVVASFESVAMKRRLRLTANVEPHLPKVHADRDRIVQVLSNLVANATQATPEGGHVTVRVEERGTDLLLAVSDSGPGISEEDVAHLFERYWRSGSAPYKGTGLGLAIARGIVAAHGGRIWAESELGRGATFLFTVPVAQDADG